MLVSKRENGRVWYALYVFGGGEVGSWTLDRARAQRLTPAECDRVAAWYRARPQSDALVFEAAEAVVAGA